MAEHLHHPLAFDGFFHKAVQLAHGFLLGHEVGAGFFAHHLGDAENHRHEHDHQQGEPDVQADHIAEGEQHRAEGGHRLGEALAQKLAHGVGVVGVAAHDFAVGALVEVTDGQVLHVQEHILAHAVQGAGGHQHHQAVVNQGGNGPGQVHAHHQDQEIGERRQIRRGLTDEGRNVAVHHVLEQVRAGGAGGGADEDAARYQQQLALMRRQVRNQPPEGAFGVLGFRGRAHRSMWRHLKPPPSAGTGTRPDKCRSGPSVRRGCPRRRSCRCPAPPPGPRPSRK